MLCTLRKSWLSKIMMRAVAIQQQQHQQKGSQHTLTESNRPNPRDVNGASREHVGQERPRPHPQLSHPPPASKEKMGEK